MDRRPSVSSLSRNQKKIVLLGDQRCGKSALMKRFTDKSFSEEYTPTVFDSSTVLVGQDKKYNIWDTPGSSEFDHMRSLSFGDAVVFILCFDVADEHSLDNIVKKWFPETLASQSSQPIILCGCKTDAFIERSTKQGFKSPRGLPTARQIGAVCYTECSSKLDSDAVKVDTLFKTAALLAAGKTRKIPKEMRVKGGFFGNNCVIQ